MTTKHRRPVYLLILLLLCAWALTALFNRYKPLPDDVGRAWPERPAHQVALLVDDTWVEADGKRHFDQAIFDEFFRLIGQAQKLVMVDMFLFNDMAGATTQVHRPLSEQLTGALLDSKNAHPDMPVVLITDPFNTLYGGLHAAHLERLRAAGVQVVLTDLTRLRDSNPSWSGLWRLCCQWLGNNTEGGWLPNVTGPGKVTLRSYLALLNFKANHRKTLVVDEGDHWTALVTSANAHDASSAHSNLALRFSGPAALDLLHSELAVARFSGADLPASLAAAPAPPAPSTPGPATPHLQILTEGAIRDALLNAIHQARPGQNLDVGVFYLSYRPLIDALITAHQRGVVLRVLLDPNKDAFGREKNGIPNRQAALDLHAAGIPVRWCATHGEQCHTKMLLLHGGNGPATAILGSANYTRRNLDNLNLETSVRLTANQNAPALRQLRDTFQRRWSNPSGKTFSLPYSAFADPSRLRYALYRLMEITGWSTF